MKLQLLVDNPNSWFVPFAKYLERDLKAKGHEVLLHHKHEDVQNGKILFILSCENILKQSILEKNELNLVVHGSDLPKGRGWSPLTWEILEGRDKFWLSLIEAHKNVDAGRIFLKTSFKLQGHELNEELKSVQGQEICKLIIKFLDSFPMLSEEQMGDPTYYARRSAKDSELDLNKSIEEQFNLLRVVDNDKYPAFFIRDGIKYIVKIYKEEIRND